MLGKIRFSMRELRWDVFRGWNVRKRSCFRRNSTLKTFQFMFIGFHTFNSLHLKRSLTGMSERQAHYSWNCDYLHGDWPAACWGQFVSSWPGLQSEGVTLGPEAQVPCLCGKAERRRNHQCLKHACNSKYKSKFVQMWGDVKIFLSNFVF